MAACSIIDKRLWLPLLARYVRMASQGCVDKGVGGELVVAILFLMARDVLLPLSSDENYLKTVCQCLDLKVMLASLLNKTAYGMLVSDCKTQSQEAKIPNPLACGKVSLSHFLRVVGRPTTEQLLLYFSRGAGILCTNHEVVIDMIIPVLMPGDDGQYRLTEENLTYLVVQVKNWKDGGGKVVANPRVDPTNHLVVHLFIQLGGARRFKNEKPEDFSTNTVYLSMYGFDAVQYPVLNHEGLQFSEDKEVASTINTLKEMEKGEQEESPLGTAMAVDTTNPTTSSLVFILSRLAGRPFNLTDFTRNITFQRTLRSFAVGTFCAQLKALDNEAYDYEASD